MLVSAKTAVRIFVIDMCLLLCLDDLESDDLQKLCPAAMLNFSTNLPKTFHKLRVQPESAQSWEPKHSLDPFAQQVANLLSSP